LLYRLLEKGLIYDVEVSDCPSPAEKGKKEPIREATWKGSAKMMELVVEEGRKGFQDEKKRMRYVRRESVYNIRVKM
jgi:hypothetical protein